MSAGRGAGRAVPRIIVGRGALATEELILSDLETLLPATETGLELLAAPVVVVVPSRSLRLHLAWRFVQRRGRPVAGLAIRTLNSLASEILSRFGERPGAGAALLPVLVRRFARREPILRTSLDPLVEGWAAPVGTVRDLLDAGFETAHTEALADLLGEKAGGAEGERAQALVRTAAAVAKELARAGLAVQAGALRRATELLREQPDLALPARRVLIHGFADATGAATDLMEALLREVGAWVYLDQPPDPAAPERPDLGNEFGRRFRERLEGVTAAAPGGGVPSKPEGVQTFRTPGISAETREVARRIRSLLDSGVTPEGIAVVARDPAAYAASIQVQFARLGIPFSALSAAGSRTAAGRRIAALSSLLRLGGETAAEVFLAAAADLTEFDLRLAVHAVGTARVADVAALNLDLVVDRGGDLPLPVRRGLAERESEGEELEERPVAPRRKVSGRRVRQLIARAAAVAGRLERWPETASLAQHLARLKRLLAEELGWVESTAGYAEVSTMLEQLDRELPRDFELAHEEFVMLAVGQLGEIASPPPGGVGGGVQVLSVIEARARTFAHLFVVGLNRDVFPRLVGEDPLLPDRLRLAIERDALPQMPIKRAGFDEERFLFAQLVSASPQVTLSYLECDDDGKARSPSPLAERLRLAAAGREVPVVGGVLTDAASGALRPAFESAILAGLHGTRGDLAAVLETAYGEDAGGHGMPSPAALAAGRVAVLEEIDPDRRTAAGRARAATLGPYFGFLGEVREDADPRRADPAVTVAEGMTGCAWQVFLRSLLRVEPPPDALAGVPGVDPLLLGKAVHRVLERIVREQAPELATSFEGAVIAPPVRVSWPPPERLEALLGEVCGELVREAGLSLPGLARVLAEQSMPFLAVAERVAFAGGQIEVTGTELGGVLRFVDGAGRERAVPFRADRVEGARGRLIATDFKTGKFHWDAVSAPKRREKLFEAVRVGMALQAAAYARATGDRALLGRYLFLEPKLDDGYRSVEVSPTDSEVLDAFDAVMRTVLQAWDAGSFSPRLEEPDKPVEPRRCSRCEVREACVRGDSGARRRLAGWAARHRGDTDQTPAEDALLALWWLPSRKGEDR